LRIDWSAKEMPIKQIHQKKLDDLCASLMNADTDIQDIILFGSSVYAPDAARDIDLLVTTARRKNSEIYSETLANFPENVDLIIREPDESIGERIAWGIRTTGQIIAGDGETLLEVMKIPVPTFERARKIICRANENFADAQKESDDDIKDEAYRDAFNKLFDVARIAVMAYLGSEDNRWGQLRRSLPDPFEKRFRQIIDILHIDFSYNGNYPKDNAEKEFRRWKRIVEKFIDDLEHNNK